jgi:hypothetical protein
VFLLYVKPVVVVDQNSAIFFKKSIDKNLSYFFIVNYFVYIEFSKTVNFVFQNTFQLYVLRSLLLLGIFFRSNEKVTPFIYSTTVSQQNCDLSLSINQKNTMTNFVVPSK